MVLKSICERGGTRVNQKEQMFLSPNLFMFYLWSCTSHVTQNTKQISSNLY